MAKLNVSSTTESFVDAINEAIERIRDTADAAEGQIRQHAGEAGELAREGARRARDQVKEHPYASAASVAAVIGAGLLLWGLLQRRL